MSNSSYPITKISLLPADIVDAFGERHDLIVGQIYLGTTAVSKELYQNVQALSNSEINTLFGIKSELTQRINAFLLASSRQVKLSVIPIADPLTSFGEGSITLDGTATKDGVLTVSIIDESKYTKEIQIFNGDKDIEVAPLVKTAIDDMTSCPIVASVTLGTVALEAKNNGLIGNTYGIKTVLVGADDLDVSITAFQNGEENPILTGIFDVIGELRITGIQWPESWDGVSEIGILKEFLEARFDADNSITDGIGFIGRSDTYANNRDFAESQNSHVLVFGGNNFVALSDHVGPIILKQADCVMAAFMAIRSKRLTEGALISGDIVARNGILDNIGGPELASLPYFNTADKRATVPSKANLTYSQLEERDLLDAGFTVFGINPPGNTIIFRSVVTTYKTDSAGNPNDSFKYLNYLDTGSVAREILFNNVKARFAQTRLTTGNLIEGRNIANAGSIKAHYLGILKLLGEFALLASGADAELEMSQQTTVSIDTYTRSAIISGPIILVTQLAELTYNLQFQFAGQQA